MHGRIRLFTAALSILVLSATAGTSSAGTMRWGAEVWGGFNTFSMGDWNDVIDAANASGTNYDNITNGFSFGGGPTVMINENWQFGVHFERLMAKKTSDEGTQIEVQPAANAFGITGAYWFPSTSTMNFGLGASVDYLTLAGKLTDPTAGDQDTEGSGIGGAVMGMTSYHWTPTFSGNLTAGYRFASVDIDNIGGQDVSSQGLSSEDYSGFSIRMGFSFTQPNTTR